MNDKLTFILLLISAFSFGQIKIKGIVTDSIGVPLEAASVVAINKVSNSLETYSLTDENGFYNKLNNLLLIRFRLVL